MGVSVSRAVEFVLVGSFAPCRLGVVLSWERSDPFAVKMDFAVVRDLDPEAGRWLVDRGLLAEGLFGRCGRGSVRVRPWDKGWTLIEMRVIGGGALVLAPTSALAEFLAQTYALVPDGDEEMRVDWDELTAAPPRHAS